LVRENNENRFEQRHHDYRGDDEAEEDNINENDDDIVPASEDEGSGEDLLEDMEK
jgi:hypothetical protein